MLDAFSGLIARAARRNLRFIAPLIRTPWQLYAMLGFLVAVGASFITYMAHSLFLPTVSCAGVATQS